MSTFISIVAAVIVANAASFALFVGVLTSQKLQKKGAADDELPLWVYPCCIIAPALVATGTFLLV